MLSRSIFSRSRISRVIKYAIVTSTILFLSTAGSNVAVLSFSDPNSALSGSRTASPPVTCATPSSGLVDWWPGEGNPNDIRGGNNAALFDGTTYASGQAGQAFRFDGINDYASVPANANWAFGTGDFTVEFWMYSTTNDDRRPLVNNRRGLGGNPNMWAIEIYNVANRVEFHSGTTILLTATTLLTNSSWNHVAVTRTGTTLNMYINGMPAGSAGNSDNFSEINDLQLGRDLLPVGIGDLGGKYFQGSMDELSIYNHSLTGTEIANIYNAGGEGKCRSATPAPVGLVSWWSGQGNTIDSRSRNDGILQNGAGFTAGLTGQAFSFYNVNDYLEIPHSDVLNLAGGLTLETWFIQRTAGYGVLFSKADYNGTQSETSYGLQINPDGSLNCALYGTYPADNWNTQPGLVVTGRWYHAAMTWDGSYANTNNVKLYLNGDLVQAWTKSLAPLNLVNRSVTIGSMKPPTYYGNLDGLIDEPAIFDRALSELEIQAIVNAGNAGKITPTAVIPPVGVVGWWPGDGYRSEFPAPGRFATLVNGAGYAVGKVGQTFAFDGVDDYAEVASSVYDPGTNAFSVEFWLKSRNNGAGTYLVGKSHPDGGQGWDIRLDNNRIQVVGVNGWALNLISDASVTANTWHHIAMSSSDTLVILYVDGVLHDTCQRQAIGTSVNPLRFGFTSNFGGTPLNGFLDEITLYNRAITPDEVRSIVNAGLAGKLKQMATQVPATMNGPSIPSAPNDGVYAFPGDATILFPVVTASGITHQIPLDPAKLPPLPMSATPTGLTYDISTSAIWSGTPSVCFNVPALSSVYRNLRILHLENGVWVNRTQVPGSTPILCSYGLTSLSPFAIVDFGPTAASVSVSGRVMTAYGNGVRNAVVQLTDQDGVMRTARTGSFGYYRFEDVRAGETYVIGVASKQFVFTPRTITVSDELTDVDMVADPTLAYVAR